MVERFGVFGLNHLLKNCITRINPSIFPSIHPIVVYKHRYNTTVTTMSDRKPFISNRNIVCAADSVALRDYHGSLHALAVNKSDSILHHYIYNDREEQWSEQQSFPEPVYSPQTAFTEYEGILYAALVVKNQLYWMTYAPTSLRWSGLSSVNEYSLGSVGIFSLDNSLYILFPEQNSHQILSLIYHSETQSWSRCEGTITVIKQPVSH